MAARPRTSGGGGRYRLESSNSVRLSLVAAALSRSRMLSLPRGRYRSSHRFCRNPREPSPPAPPGKSRLAVFGTPPKSSLGNGGRSIIVNNDGGFAARNTSRGDARDRRPGGAGQRELVGILLEGVEKSAPSGVPHTHTRDVNGRGQRARRGRARRGPRRRATARPRDDRSTERVLADVGRDVTDRPWDAAPPHAHATTGAQSASSQMSAVTSPTGAHGARTPSAPAHSTAGRRPRTGSAPRSMARQAPVRPSSQDARHARGRMQQAQQLMREQAGSLQLSRSPPATEAGSRGAADHQLPRAHGDRAQRASTIVPHPHSRRPVAAILKSRIPASVT